MVRKFIVLLWLWLVAGVAASVALMLLKPEGALKWALWAVAIVPMGFLSSAAVEGAAHLFMSLPGMRQGTSYVETRAAGKTFSAVRAAWYAFSAVLGFIVIVAGATTAWNGYSLVCDFIAQDRCLDEGGQWKADESLCQYQSSSAW